MNYQQVYNNFIQQRKNNVTASMYHETHHIVPKCLGGTDDADNLVRLTAREHFFAHWILTKIYPKAWGIYFAFFQMAKTNNKNMRSITSHQYEIAKRACSTGAKLRAKDPTYLNPGKTPKSRETARQRMKTANPMSLFPEKNPGAKKVKVSYTNGNVVEYLLLKDFYNTLPPMTSYSRKKCLKNKEFLLEFGICDIEVENKENPVENRTWYNNGISNVYLKASEQPPPGYQKGMAPYNRK